MFHEGGTNNFVFQNEDVVTNLVSDLLIGGIGILLIIIAVKNIDLARKRLRTTGAFTKAGQDNVTSTSNFS